MKHNSSITFDEAIRVSMHHCPIKIYYNRKCIWDDMLSIDEGWLSLERALDNFRNANKDYERILITDIKVKVVQWHHSIIYLKGKFNKRKDKKHETLD